MHLGGCRTAPRPGGWPEPKAVRAVPEVAEPRDGVKGTREPADGLRDRSPRMRRSTPWRTRRRNHLRCVWALARTASGRCSSTKNLLAVRSVRVLWTDHRCGRSTSPPDPSSRRPKPTAGYLRNAASVRTASRQGRTELNTASPSAISRSSTRIDRSAIDQASSNAARSQPGRSPASSGGVHHRSSSRTARLAIVVSVTSPRSLIRITSSASG